MKNLKPIWYCLGRFGAMYVLFGFCMYLGIMALTAGGVLFGVQNASQDAMPLMLMLGLPVILLQLLLPIWVIRIALKNTLWHKYQYIRVTPKIEKVTWGKATVLYLKQLILGLLITAVVGVGWAFFVDPAILSVSETKLIACMSPGMLLVLLWLVQRFIKKHAQIEDLRTQAD